MLILHGDNTVASRQALAAELTKLTSQPNHSHTVRLDAGSLVPAELQEALGSSDLFGNHQLVVLECLHSLPRGARRQQLINLAAAVPAATMDATTATAPADGGPPSRLILWEQRQLTPTMLKQFPQAKVRAFKLGKAVFKWVQEMTRRGGQSSTQLTKLHQAINQDSAWTCLAMAARQLRLLLLVKAGGKPALAPFMVSQLSNQARTVELAELIEWQRRLGQIDIRHKTGQSSLSIEQELDLWQLSLYSRS
ncbi:MAG: hypothetical protein COU69_02990 [Candidatus Pacebacteria bacterium CG10_big_fil_rev_8_21_14_0_10_56_10]|nr:MAG: hypothetical protein COU69_02990 [Candidatus Pacebacteria bacterium CG10_big_fil_rev_8_21_14_0_10_56_10]